MHTNRTKAARSTLSPGVVSSAIAKLRDMAINEMDRQEPNRGKVTSMKFDKDNSNFQRKEVREDDNGVANFAGVFSPHIGNGTGGAR